MLNHSINLIDPSKVYLVKDLYSLGEKKLSDLPRSVHTRVITHSKMVTDNDISILFNSPMHSLSVKDLKLVYLIYLLKFKDKIGHYIKYNWDTRKNDYINRKITNFDSLKFVDGIDVILCHLSRFKHISAVHVSSDNFSESVRDIINFKFDLIGSVDVSNYNLEGTFSKELYRSRGIYTRVDNSLKIPFSKEDRLKPEVIQHNHCSKYRRPFLKELNDYPTHRLKSTSTYRLRDIMIMHLKNNDNRWLPYRLKLSRYREESVNDLMKFLHKTKEELTLKDLREAEELMDHCLTHYKISFMRVKNELIKKVKN